MLMVLTQPPFSRGNLRLLTLAATLEAALQEEPQASRVQNAHQVHDGILDTYRVSCYIR
jgi:hypothetical protein